MHLPSSWSLNAKKLDRVAIVGAVLLPGGLLLGAGWLWVRWRALARRSPSAPRPTSAGPLSRSLR